MELISGGDFMDHVGGAGIGMGAGAIVGLGTGALTGAQIGITTGAIGGTIYGAVVGAESMLDKASKGLKKLFSLF